MEAVLLLTSLLRRLRFSAASAEPVQLQPSVTLRPKAGVHLRVEPRSPDLAAAQRSPGK